MKQLQQFIRLQANDGSWKPFAFTIAERNPEPQDAVTIRVPSFNGEWIISETGMVANVGGNDWRIYTLHPDDCKAICAYCMPHSSMTPDMQAQAAGE
jgi:hypothetical protein